MQRLAIWGLPVVLTFALAASLQREAGPGLDDRPVAMAGAAPPALPICEPSSAATGSGDPVAPHGDARQAPPTPLPVTLPDPPADGRDRFRLTPAMRTGLRLLGEGWTAELFDLQGDAGAVTRFRLDGRGDAEDLVAGVPLLPFPFALRVEWTWGGSVASLRQLLGNPRLRALTLRDCSLHAPGVAELFAGVPELEHLDIAGCRLDGDSLAAITARLPELRTLRMDQMPWPVGRMPETMASLRFLDLRDTRLAMGAWKTVAGYPRLEVLLAARERQHRFHVVESPPDLAAIATCKTLRELDLSGCPVGDRFQTLLTALPRLERLRVADGDAFIAELPSPSRMGPLMELDVRGNVLSPRALADVLRLPRLQVFRAGQSWERAHARIMPSAPSNIEELDLSHAPIDGSHIELLGRFPKLSRLNLTGIEVQATERISRIPGLEHLDLTDTFIHEWKQLAPLAERAKLKSLTLTNCPLGPDLTAALDRFATLELLHLSGCRLVDRDLAALPKLERLADLDLSFNPGITDAGLRTVAKIASLRRLRLCNKWGLGPRITADGLRWFLNNRPEVMVDCRPAWPASNRIVPSPDP